MPSTIVDVTGSVPRVLRVGEVTVEALREVVADLHGRRNSVWGTPRFEELPDSPSLSGTPFWGPDFAELEATDPEIADVVAR